MAKTDKDDLISRQGLKLAKFPAVTNLYTEGWNDAIDSIIENEPPAETESECMGYTAEQAEEVVRIARSIAQTSGVSMNEATQAIRLAMRPLPPLGDAEIAMIRNNPSLNIFQKWWLIHKLKKRRIMIPS